MKPEQPLSLLLIGALLAQGCSSTTVITTIPPEAKLYVNEEYVGTTPFSHSDTRILASTTYLRMEKEGYESFSAVLQRNEEVDAGALVAGIFVLIPLLWVMKYKPTHTYELIALGEMPVEQPSKTTMPAQAGGKSKAERLRELKQLQEEGIITAEEFEKEKKKILEEGDN